MLSLIRVYGVRRRRASERQQALLPFAPGTKIASMRNSTLSTANSAGRLLVLSIAVVSLGSAGCQRAEPSRDAVYMSAPFVGLVGGFFDGEVPFAELKRHGDVALGAMESVDGELVVVDGEGYQVKADGSVAVIQDSQRTPYAIAKLFRADQTLEVAEESDFPRLRQLLDEKLGSPALPYAFRIEGRFSQVTTRSVARQKPPYRRLIEVIKDQVIFQLENVSGVIVGFRFPAYVEGINVPGYHLEEWIRLLSIDIVVPKRRQLKM